VDAQDVARMRQNASKPTVATGSTDGVHLPPLPPPVDSPETDQLSPASPAPVEKVITQDEAQVIYIYPQNAILICKF